MKRFVLCISACVVLFSGCTSEEDKYIGKYSIKKDTLELKTDGKCSYADLSCKWNVEKKEITLNAGKEDILINIISIEDDILTTSPSGKSRKDKIFKQMGTHWNQIVGDYKSSGIWNQIKLNNDGSFEGGLANGKWEIRSEDTIKLYPNRGNKLRWDYKDNQLFFQGKSICQK